MFGWNANPDAQPLPEIGGHVANSRLERVLRAGNFAVTAELAPPDSGNAEDVYQRAAVFDGVVDGMNATDGSGANCHMSSVGMCALLTNVGYSPVMQISCRDRNRIAIQGDVLGAYAMGVRNVLCLSGDGVQVGDHPQAKPVFDLDSISLLETIRIMRDESRYLSGRAITTPPKMLLGAAENPCAPPYDFRPYRLAKKVAAGANFIQTQYIFDVERLREFLAKSRDLGLLEQVFILPGVGPIASARTARWISKNVPGIYIPESVINRLEGAEDQKREGQNICVELIQQISELEGVSGVHVMAYRQEESVREIIQRSAVLGERVPWYPGIDEDKGDIDK